MYNALIYHLQPFGVEDSTDLPPKMKIHEMDMKYNITEISENPMSAEVVKE